MTDIPSILPPQARGSIRTSGRLIFTPSPGTPGEGWGGGSLKVRTFAQPPP